LNNDPFIVVGVTIGTTELAGVVDPCRITERGRELLIFEVSTKFDGIKAMISTLLFFSDIQNDE